jgi:hypothetical protein
MSATVAKSRAKGARASTATMLPPSCYTRSKSWASSLWRSRTIASARLRPGSYMLFCNAPGHYAAGQHMLFNARGPDCRSGSR